MTNITRTGVPGSIDKRRATAGDMASSVFELLERGVPPDEIVVELGLSPDVLENLLRTWARLRGLVPLTAEGADALRCLLYQDRAFANGTELLTALRRFADRVSLVCRACGKEAADYCLACPAHEARRAGKRKAKRPQPPSKTVDPTAGALSAEVAVLMAKAETRRE